MVRIELPRYNGALSFKQWTKPLNQGPLMVKWSRLRLLNYSGTKSSVTKFIMRKVLLVKVKVHMWYCILIFVATDVIKNLINPLTGASILRDKTLFYISHWTILKQSTVKCSIALRSSYVIRNWCFILKGVDL